MPKKRNRKHNQQLPKQVFVTWESDPNDDEDGGYFIVASNTETMDHGDVIGVYALISTHRLAVSRTLK